MDADNSTATTSPSQIILLGIRGVRNRIQTYTAKKARNIKTKSTKYKTVGITSIRNDLFGDNSITNELKTDKRRKKALDRINARAHENKKSTRLSLFLTMINPKSIVYVG